MKNNKLIIACAGSGKTTFLVKEALEDAGKVLITTYTISNAEEIRKKIIQLNNFVPKNITIQTWFSFLLQHGVRPYQSTIIDGRIKGIFMVNEASGFRYMNNKGVKIYWGEDSSPQKHYLAKDSLIYTDKLAKFVVKSNANCNGKVIDRLARIYESIYVDEIQDLAGYDLEILKLLFRSKIKMLLVGDPRQVTYLTHIEKINGKYKNGKIEEYINEKCPKNICEIDKSTHSVSHRNNAAICSFSSKLYPSLPISSACNCPECRINNIPHQGIFVIRKADVSNYISFFEPTLLRYSGATGLEWNFGKSKGLGFNRVLIYPTQGIINYLITGNLEKQGKTGVIDAFDIAKFYVAITRARHSVGIVYNFSELEELIPEVKKYFPGN